MQTFLEYASFNKVYNAFVPFIKSDLDLDTIPKIKIIRGNEAQKLKAFGCWDGTEITLCPDNRHPMDVMRTLAHEIIHYMCDHTDGSDGSADENEANSKAGEIMRRFARANPSFF